MDSKHLIKLIRHWNTLAAEAREQAANAKQPSVFRAHAFGISDGLEMALNDVLRMLHDLGEDETAAGDTAPPKETSSGKNP